MTDLAAALGLMLVLEGAVYALFPDQMRRAMEVIRRLPENQVRTAGLAAALVGLMIVGIARS